MREKSLLRSMTDTNLRASVEALVLALARLETTPRRPKSAKSERRIALEYIAQINGFLNLVSKSDVGLTLNTLTKLGRALLDVEQGVQPASFLQRDTSEANRGAPPLGVFHHELRATAVSGTNMLREAGVGVELGCKIVAQDMKRLKIEELFPRANREFGAKTVKNWRRRYNTPTQERLDRWWAEEFVLSGCGADQNSKISVVRRELDSMFRLHLSGLMTPVPDDGKSASESA